MPTCTQPEQSVTVLFMPQQQRYGRERTDEYTYEVFIAESMDRRKYFEGSYMLLT